MRLTTHAGLACCGRGWVGGGWSRGEKEEFRKEEVVAGEVEKQGRRRR